MKTLFEPVQAGTLHLRNRIVMATLTRHRAPEAIPTPEMAQYYAQRASAGLIIGEATAITHQGQGHADVPGLYGTEQLDGWMRVTQAVHDEGGRIVCQLWHAGRVSHVELQPQHQLPVAPSAIAARTRTYLMREGQGGFVSTSEPRALDAEEIPGIVRDFRHAARYAITAGFDGVEVHGADGYLIDQFLKSGANRRTDDYGGTIVNRARFLLEVMRAVCEEVGHGRVGLRLGPVTHANDIDDADPQPLFDHVMRELAPLQLAFLHIAEGARGGPRKVQGRPFDDTRLRQAWREAGARGSWMVDTGDDEALAVQALAQGADLVAFGHSFIANPDLVERLRSGAPLNQVDKATQYDGAAQGFTDDEQL